MAYNSKEKEIRGRILKSHNNKCDFCEKEKGLCIHHKDRSYHAKLHRQQKRIAFKFNVNGYDGSNSLIGNYIKYNF